MMGLLRAILLPLRVVSTALYIVGRIGLVGFGIVVAVVMVAGVFVLVGA